MRTGCVEELPDTVAGIVADAARRWGARTAWRFDETGARLSFAELDRRSSAMAVGLREAGVEPGDRVAVMLRNVPEFPLLWLASAKLGAALVPLNVHYREQDARHVLARSGAVLAVTAPEFEPLLESLRTQLPALRAVRGADSLEAGAGDLEWEALPESACNVQYTSGTTGSPKGCVLSNTYWVTIARHLLAEFPRLTSEDVLLTAQPFHYVDPQWNVIGALAAGAELVVLDRFHPSTFWAKVREHRVTLFYCLGMMPTLLLRQPESESDLDHDVRAIICSAIPAESHAELERRWGVAWYESFGMTESGADIGVSPEDHDELVGSGAIGRPYGHREARVFDADGNQVPRGETGELVLRGTGMMDGYFEDPEATAAVFRHGWLHTGDLVRMDERGRIHYLGRKKDMIRRSGENIAAAEVEEALRAHPAVAVCAVLPRPDALRGEEVEAFLVLAEGYELADAPPEVLAEHCARRLAYFKVPRFWAYREHLPSTPSERVAKARLRSEDGPCHDLRADPR